MKKLKIIILILFFANMMEIGYSMDNANKKILSITHFASYKQIDDNSNKKTERIGYDNSYLFKDTYLYSPKYMGKLTIYNDYSIKWEGSATSGKIMEERIKRFLEG